MIKRKGLRDCSLTRTLTYLQLMGDKQDGFGFQVLPYCAVEDVVSNVGIQGAERVVKDVNALVTVQCSGKADPLALSPTEVCTALTNLG